MGWAVGFDTRWNRDIGYGVPATCDFPECGADIDRGLSYVCGSDPYGGDQGCGLFFCYDHLYSSESSNEFGRRVRLCVRCDQDTDPFEPTPDVQEWIHHKQTDPSWHEWRMEQKEMTSD